MLFILLLVATVILWGTTPVIEKIGLGTKVEPIVGLVIRSTAVLGALVLAMLFRPGLARQVMSADSRTLILFSTSGLLAGLLGMLTYFGALKMGLASRVVPLCATYPLVAAVLGMLILKESFSPLRMLGTVLVVAGMWLVIAK